MSLQVSNTGPLLTVQDLGRPGLAGIGVPPGGAADRAALREGNRMLGNPADAAGLELLMGGAEFVAHADVVVALTGAPTPMWRGDAPVALGEPVRLRPGDVLRIGVPTAGLRSYLTVRGGFAVEPELRSRASSPRAGIGPAPLRSGGVLPVGPVPEGEVELGHRPESLRTPGAEVEVRVVLGPRDDWFTPEAVRTFLHTAWAVGSDADRVGIRLDGPELTRGVEGELLSEGMVRGSVQVPPSGRPIVFGPDHPTTGGYPVIGVVVDADVDLLWQLPPGASVRFRRVRAPW